MGVTGVSRTRLRGIVSLVVAAVRRAVLPLSLPWVRAASGPADLPGSLDEFRGPESGIVEAPVRLYWSGDRFFDVSDPDDAADLYSAVILNGSIADLTERISGKRLAEVWDRILIPWAKRQAFEGWYPQLRAARTLAAV